jgi:chromosome segregation ATPase
MNMIDIIIGAAAGFVGGLAAKDKLMPDSKSKNQIETLQQRLNIQIKQTDEAKKTITDLRNELDKCNAELKNCRNKFHSTEDKFDDLEDEKDNLKSSNRRLLDENEDLKQKVHELEMLNEAKRQTIESVSNK